MSRSYKHTPYAGDTKTKWAKRQANRKYRSFLKQMEEDVPYSHFKKVSESWNICDYHDITTWEEHLRYRQKHHRYTPYGMKFLENGEIDIENERKLWEKWYKRK